VPPPVHQLDRDQAIYRAWVDGRRQDDLAEQYGVTQQAISKACTRYVATLPEPEQAMEVRRSLDLVDDLLAVWVPRARAGNPAASREVRGLLALRGRFGGLDRRELHVEGTIDHAHHVEPGPTPAELLERWRQEGKLTVRGELTRIDQEARP
jgi:hypothetical protein